jgi:lipoate-protein ligase A
VSEVSIEVGIGGRENMARDVALLQRAEVGGIAVRVYTWDGPWVSLGRFQRPERALLRPTETDWVVRPTGGKAVLHGHDVTVGLAAHLHDLGLRDLAARRVSTVYRAVVGSLVEALCGAGLRCTLAERTAHVRSGGHTADCFAHVSPNDVVDPETGEKVCGCALRVTERAVLLQASIPVGEPLVEPAHVFAAPHTPARVRDLSLEALAEGLRTIRPPETVLSMD